MHCGKQSEKRSLNSSRRKEQKLKHITFHRSFFSSPAHLRNPQVVNCVHPEEGLFIDPPLTRDVAPCGSPKGMSYQLNCLNPRTWSQSPSGINDSKSMVAEHCDAFWSCGAPSSTQISTNTKSDSVT